MNKFNIISRKERAIIGATEVTQQISLRDETMMTIQDLKDLETNFVNNARLQNKNIKLMIRGLNIQKWITLKGFNTVIEVDGLLDYYQNKVDNANKFLSFYQVQITMIKSN